MPKTADPDEFAHREAKRQRRREWRESYRTARRAELAKRTPSGRR